MPASFSPVAALTYSNSEVNDTSTTGSDGPTSVKYTSCDDCDIFWNDCRT